MKRTVTRLLLIELACLLVACASDKPPALPVAPPPRKPLSGEQILRESQGMEQLGQRYIQGENLVHQGEDLINEGKQKIGEGERLIDEGKRIMRESEQGYGEIKR